MENHKVSREAKVLVGILVVVIGGMIALFVATNKPQSSTGATADASKLVKADSHKTDTGSIQVVEFGDYQCPACGAAYPVTKQIMSEYKGKITFYFRNFPLPMHPNAPAAAYAAEAAAKQDKFWEMHDKLYDTQNDWADLTGTAVTDKFNGYAGDLGLDVDQFKTDQASAAIKAIVDADKTDGTALNIQGTPTFYVNGKQAVDYSKSTLENLINEQLNKK